MNGVALCARYAFGPNRLNMCGPDMSKEVLAYINAGAEDQGLANILKDFQTLSPYLTEIAHANKIRDPFDERVVEAYWIGNELLENIQPKTFYKHLVENVKIKKRVDSKSMDYLSEKLTCGARMHHSFHVFNIWQRTGHSGTTHTLESMDNCRVSPGKVLNVDGPVITVLRKPLIVQNRKLALGAAVTIKVMRRLESSTLIDEVKKGDIISIHWGMPCEILNKRRFDNLVKYTNLSLLLANRTI